MSFTTKLDREIVGGRIERMNRLIASGAYGDMTHEEAYDAVYLKEPWPGHKEERLRNITEATK